MTTPKEILNRIQVNLYLEELEKAGIKVSNEKFFYNDRGERREMTLPIEDIPLYFIKTFISSEYIPGREISKRTLYAAYDRYADYYEYEQKEIEEKEFDLYDIDTGYKASMDEYQSYRYK